MNEILKVGEREYRIVGLERAAESLGIDIRRLPVSLRILLENLLRHEDGDTVAREDIRRLASWKPAGAPHEIAFHPVRVLMPDSSGIPLLADLAAMRDAMARRGGDPSRVNPRCPVDLVIDHSIVAEHAGTPDAFARNLAMEYADNAERYAFARWAQQAFANLRIVPPGSGIIHQVNLEHLARPVWPAARADGWHAFPDTLVGMDSHTPMINALGVLGWGVGGIEAASAMLGEPISMLIPEVVGCRLQGRLRPGITCTDLALTVTQRLRRKGVVGKLVEFCGPGLDSLALPDRATLSNMAPEYGATMGFFSIDDETLRFLRLTGRDPLEVALAEAYAKAQGLWRREDADISYSGVIEIDLAEVEPSVAGPKRPQDRMALSRAPESFSANHPSMEKKEQKSLRSGDIVIAAITSCTNTSNPSAMLAAGLLAKKAVALGLRKKPWVKTSLSPGSRVVSDYLQRSGLQAPLDALGFQLTGYGCMTCAGASGSLAPELAREIEDASLAVCAVLSSNRNFEGRIHPQVKAAYLASPPLVVAYAIAGSIRLDLTKVALGEGAGGQPVYLEDLWPTNEEIEDAGKSIVPAMFAARYAGISEGDARWKAIGGARGPLYPWDARSERLRRPPFLDEAWIASRKAGDIRAARVLLLLGDGVTTDYISPGKLIPWRANHETMARGTFGDASVHEAALRHAAAGTPLVVIAGREYGTGSSRDWAAKGPALLGVRAVIAESFERIHRSNLVGMGVLPLEFPDGVTQKTLGLDGSERFDLTGLERGVAPGMALECRIEHGEGRVSMLELRCRVDTRREAAWFAAGGILNYVLEQLSAQT